MDLIIPSFDGLLARWTICLPLPFSFSAPLWWPHSLFLSLVSHSTNTCDQGPFCISSPRIFILFTPSSLHLSILLLLLRLLQTLFTICRISLRATLRTPVFSWSSYLSLPYFDSFVLCPETVSWKSHISEIFEDSFQIPFFLLFSSLSRIFMDDLIFMLPCISEFPDFVDLLFLQFKHFPFLIWSPNSIVFIPKYEHRFRLIFLFSSVIKPHHIRCSLSVYLPVCFSAPLHISYLFPPPPGFSLVLCSPSPPSALAAAFDPLSSPFSSIFSQWFSQFFVECAMTFAFISPIFNTFGTSKPLEIRWKCPRKRLSNGFSASPLKSFSCSDVRSTHFVTFGQKLAIWISLSDYNLLIRAFIFDRIHPKQENPPW